MSTRAKIRRREAVAQGVRHYVVQTRVNEDINEFRIEPRDDRVRVIMGTETERGLLLGPWTDFTPDEARHLGWLLLGAAEQVEGREFADSAEAQALHGRGLSVSEIRALIEPADGDANA